MVALCFVCGISCMIQNFTFMKCLDKSTRRPTAHRARCGTSMRGTISKASEVLLLYLTVPITYSWSFCSYNVRISKAFLSHIVGT